jgi:DNA-binding HxlR family transcriptional regulator
MSWATKFTTWKVEGKTTEWLTSRLNALHNGGYINDTEYNEILAIINA